MTTGNCRTPAPRMPAMGKRLERESKTMAHMVDIYCSDLHEMKDVHPCAECTAFLRYAERRLEKCPYGDRKPTCARCPIHCYKRAQREMARAIMRYAGPRMILRHPWLALCHGLDKFRRVEHPLVARGQAPPVARSRSS